MAEKKPDPRDVLSGISAALLDQMKALAPYREIDQRLIIADYLLKEAFGKVEQARRALD